MEPEAFDAETLRLLNAFVQTAFEHIPPDKQTPSVKNLMMTAVLLAARRGGRDKLRLVTIAMEVGYN